MVLRRLHSFTILLLYLTDFNRIFNQMYEKLFLPRSKAEKAFRPWWDFLEDWLMNSLVLLGE
jgi:hypothetical protein